jgi:hypothetical protein
MRAREEVLSESVSAANIVEVIKDKADGTREQLILEQAARRTTASKDPMHFACFTICSPSQLLT